MIPKVFALIASVSADIAVSGISKDRKNTQQGYSFRGIDDVYNALAPILAKHKLVIVPRIVSRSCVERTTQKGGVLFSVIVEAEFDFVSAEDGSKVTARTYGEAMDSGDKATNKAMSAAYKYAAFQTFCIPTEGDNDADAHTHVIVPEQTYDDWLSDITAKADKSSVDALVNAVRNSPATFKERLRADKSLWEKLEAKAKANEAVPA